MSNFWAQNGPFPRMIIFFRKPVNEPCFFHSGLSTCQKSKSDVNLFVKYWQLKNTEISFIESHFLVITWEPEFSQACSFRRMLMNHKNFHFRQILDKTKDVIFLKSPKTMFFGHFFIQLCHTQPYMGPRHRAKFQKKLRNQCQENLQTDRRTDGKMDGQTLFYRTLPAKARGPKKVRGLTPWTPNRVLPITHCEDYSASRPQHSVQDNSVILFHEL